MSSARYVYEPYGMMDTSDRNGESEQTKPMERLATVGCTDGAHAFARDDLRIWRQCPWR